MIQTATATGSASDEVYSDNPVLVRSELRRRFRRQLNDLGVAGHPIVIVYRARPHVLTFEWFVGPEALRIGRERRVSMRRYER